MDKEKVLVVGLGEVGRPLFEILKESGKFEVYGLDADVGKMQELKQSALPKNVDVMHVCIPCTNKEEFIESVVSHAGLFKPKLIIINSTVPPETTGEVYQQCGCQSLVAHSPVRGVHKNTEHMKWELRRWTKYIGGVNIESATAAKKHFEKAGFRVKILRSSVDTELAKLFETTYRAWMIACFQEMHRIAKCFKGNFDDVLDFLEDTHRVRFDRPIMFPAVIGGHCLIPNTKLLLSVYDSEFLHLILKSNEKRKGEMKDPEVQMEVEKTKLRVEALEKELCRKLF